MQFDYIDKASFENFYYLVGFLVFSGFSSIVAGITFAIKKIVWISKMEYRIERLEKDLNHAFQKIRNENQRFIDIEAKYYEILSSNQSVINSKPSNKTNTKKGNTKSE